MVDGESVHSINEAFASESEYKHIYVQRKPARSQASLYGFRLRDAPTKVVTVGTPIAREFAFEVLCHNEWNGDEKLLNMPSGKRGTDGVIR
jgi:hypothetical protein